MAKIDADKVIAFLSEKWKGRSCPACGQGPWSVQNTIYQLTEFNKDKVVIGGGPVFPVIPVVCTHCGNTALVNAIAAGFVDPDPEV